MKTPWQYFDAIFCINLPHREDRWKNAQKEFSKVGLENIVEKVDGVVNEIDPVEGCKQAHLNAISLAKKRKLNNVLIFEDDVEFKVDNINLINKIISQLKKNKNWAMFYLGSIPGMHLNKPIYGKVKDIKDDNLLLVDGFYGCHAYALNKIIFDEVLNNSQSYKEIDKYLVKTIAKKYMALHAYPLICRQIVDYSDINGMTLNRNDTSDYLKEQRNLILSNMSSMIQSYDDYDVIEGKIIHTYKYKFPIKFFINNSVDPIQKLHLLGEFYEHDELKLIEKYISKDSIVLDIGANIGNHMLYFSKIMEAKKVIVVEANEAACDILSTNISINNLKNIDTSYLKFALGASKKRVVIKGTVADLGAVYCIEDEIDGNTIMLQGDDFFSKKEIDFIKIDVSGMELDVIKGLRKTLIRNNAVLFMCVRDIQFKTFIALMEKYNYDIVEKYKRFPSNTNYILKKR